jgi:uncharacterized Zn finger protein
METNLEQLKCGNCGEKKHLLFIRPNGEILAECTKCGNVSEIVVTKPKIEIRNVKGDGTLAKY